MSETQADETAGMAALRATETRRLELLRRIGEARGSRVLTYFTSYRKGWGSRVLTQDLRILEKHIAQARADGVRRIDLFLSTYGGDAAFPWGFHAMLRDYLPKTKLGVILPYEAYSAGTGIALGGDEIVMGLSSVMGPSDTQAGGYFWDPEPTGGGVSSLRGFFDLLRDFDLKGRLDDRQMLDWLTRNSNPLMLGEVYRIFRENRRKLRKILESRLKPLPAREHDRILDFFLYDVGNHGQAIRRREAQEAGVSYITDLEATGLEADVADLFAAYAEVMQLFTPFSRRFPTSGPGGFAGDHDLNGEFAGATPVVMIESLYETHAGFRAYGHDRHWQPVDQPERRAPVPGQPETARAAAEQPLTLAWASEERRVRRR